MQKEYSFSDLSFLAEHWESGLVARKDVGKFSGGALNPRTMANMDSRGEGPKGAFRLGRKVVYRVEELIRWMEKRAEQR